MATGRQFHQDGGRRGRPAGDTALRALPPAQSIKYFSDSSKKALNPDLVDRKAEELAKEIRKVPASQIRRFYSDVTSFARRVAADRELPDDAVRVQMALLKAKAAYAHRRAPDRNDKESFPLPLLQFFVDHAKAVQDRKDFDAFRRTFEAVIAYHKFHEEKRRD